MENVVEDKVKKQTNSLMKKTKVQLVDIILRKDEVEKTLRNKLDATTKEYATDIANANRLIEAEAKEVEQHKADFEEISDYAASLEAEITDERKKTKSANKALTAIIIAFSLYVLTTGYMMATML